MGVGKPQDKITPGRHRHILKVNNGEIRRHMRNGLLSSGFVFCPVADSFKQCNKYSGSIEVTNFLTNRATLSSQESLCSMELVSQSSVNQTSFLGDRRYTFQDLSRWADSRNYFPR
jgi:hypothetical protein